MACVIERFGFTIDGAGGIHYDDRPATFEQAEKIAGRKLDRRKNYALIDGEVADLITWSQACSGCYEGYESSNSVGNGCDECGYTGRRRHAAWVPILTPNVK